MAELAISVVFHAPKSSRYGDGITVRFRRVKAVFARQAEASLTEWKEVVLALLRCSDVALPLREIRSLIDQNLKGLLGSCSGPIPEMW